MISHRLHSPRKGRSRRDGPSTVTLRLRRAPHHSDSGWVSQVKRRQNLYDKSVVMNDSSRTLRVCFQVINLRGHSFATTASFLINRVSIRKLHDLYAEE